MTEPTRYGAAVENGTLYLEREHDHDHDHTSDPEPDHDHDPIEIGSMDTVVELVGGETYTLEYEPRQTTVSWLSTDEDDTITFDVREALTDWAYTDEFVENVRNSPLETTDEDGYPVRTAVFAEMVVAIWDSKGNLTQ